MKNKIVLIALALVLSAAAGYYTPALADGGPLPLCPPCKPGQPGGKNCGPNCDCPVYHCLKTLLNIK